MVVRASHFRLLEVTRNEGFGRLVVALTMTLSEPDKRCGCGAGHATFGACLRSKGVQVDRYSLTQNGQPLEKRKNETLGRYADARRAGYQPEGCLRKDMDKFDRDLTKGTAERA